jgi:hypothetical protein
MKQPQQMSPEQVAQMQAMLAMQSENGISPQQFAEREFAAREGGQQMDLFSWLGMDGMPTAQTVVPKQGASQDEQPPSPPRRPSNLQASVGSKTSTDDPSKAEEKGQTQTAKAAPTGTTGAPKQPKSLADAEAGLITENPRTGLKGKAPSAMPSDTSYGQIAAQAVAPVVDMIRKAATEAGRSPVDVVRDVMRKVNPEIAENPRTPLAPDAQQPDPKTPIMDKMREAAAQIAPVMQSYADTAKQAMASGAASAKQGIGNVRENMQRTMNMDKYRSAGKAAQPAKAAPKEAAPAAPRETMAQSRAKANLQYTGKPAPDVPPPAKAVRTTPQAAAPQAPQPNALTRGREAVQTRAAGAAAARAQAAEAQRLAQEQAAIDAYEQMMSGQPFRGMVPQAALGPANRAVNNARDTGQNTDMGLE